MMFRKLAVGEALKNVKMISTWDCEVKIMCNALLQKLNRMRRPAV